MLLSHVIVGGCLLALPTFQPAAAQSFTADAAVGTGPGTTMGEPNTDNAAKNAMADPRDPDAILERQGLDAEEDNIRAISDEFAADGNAQSSTGLTNMVWSFGQFIDHDVALGIEDVRFGTPFPIGAEEGSFNAEREVATFRRGCPAALNIHTGQVDAGMIYGTNPDFLRDTLRIPGLCDLRIAGGSDAEFPPVTTTANAQGQFFFLAGDLRIIEHSFLFSQHTLWLREHNRLCREARRDPANSGRSEEELFQLVQTVVIAKVQQVVLTEFLPALGVTQADLEGAPRLINTPDTSTEFSMAYRLGHDMVPSMVGDLSVVDLFQPIDLFLERKATPQGPALTYRENADDMIDILLGNLSTTLANELDGQISDALRNSLFGRKSTGNPMGGQDLVGRNIFRSREVNLPTYAGLARCFGISPDMQTERETPDAWMGMVREPRVPGGVLGPTQRAVIVEQFHRSFFGPGGLYWRDDLAGLGAFRDEVEESTYATIINANTNANVRGNVFQIESLDADG